MVFAMARNVRKLAGKDSVRPAGATETAMPLGKVSHSRRGAGNPVAARLNRDGLRGRGHISDRCGRSIRSRGCWRRLRRHGDSS